jgi:hypothetical protein
MEPIISPWIFYWIDILCNLKDMAIFIQIACGIIVLLSFAIIGEFLDSIELPDGAIKWFYIIVATIFILATLIEIFTPSQETLYAMLAANFVTPDNINLGVEGVKTIIDYIIESAATFVAGVNGTN